MNIGIIGQGFVGNAVYQKFKNFYEVLTYDLQRKLCNSSLVEVHMNCDYIFVCLPTPMSKDGSCHIGIVEETLEELNNYCKLSGKGITKTAIIKSTIPPGTTEKWNNKFSNLTIVFNPEFLTEVNAVQDYENQNRIILGGPRKGTTPLKPIFSKVFPKAKIIKTNSTYAEMVKYTTNCFLAMKVSFANEMYELCSKLNLDFDKVIEYTLFDPRIGNSHLNVPGPDGDFGFGGHCFPKDLSAIIKLTEEIGSTNNILNSIIKTNDKVRKNRDWEKMKGRAVN